MSVSIGAAVGGVSGLGWSATCNGGGGRLRFVVRLCFGDGHVVCLS